MSEKKATLIGLCAIVLWSSIVGLIRGVSEGLGAIGGAAMIYSLSALLLLFIVGLPDLRRFPRRYLFIGSLLFVSYEICLSLSLGYATTRTQAIEVGMVNYLWPSLTILLSVLLTRQKATLWIVPGTLLAIVGVSWALSGDEGLSLTMLWQNVKVNPLSYGLALAGALIWAIYCVITRLIAQGSNGITLFFILTALTLWLKFASTTQPAMTISVSVIVQLLLAAVAMGCGYAAWNIGILHGNVTILVTASYFIPVLSAALAAILLRTPLNQAFWQGAAMVCCGSLLCWWSTREKTVPEMRKTRA